MHICHVMPAFFPVARYGGAERAAYYLAKGLAELGHQNTFLCKQGSKIAFAQTKVWDSEKALEAQIPADADIVQLYSTPLQEPVTPYLVCIQGNGKPGEKFMPNTVFLCEDHARRHNWTEYVFNGIDPSEYPFVPVKSQELVFLAKASWGIKNLKGAIALSKRAQRTLNVCGGEASLWQRLFSSHAHFYGMVGGQEKLEIISRSQALLFSVLWHEPFGIAIIEALACGSAVLGSNWGSLPEIVDRQSGFLCESVEDYDLAFESLNRIDPSYCRQRVEKCFSHRVQAEGYLKKYRTILDKGKLREGQPFCSEQFIQESVRKTEGLPLSLKMEIKRWRQKGEVVSSA